MSSQKILGRKKENKQTNKQTCTLKQQQNNNKPSQINYKVLTPLRTSKSFTPNIPPSSPALLLSISAKILFQKVCALPLLVWEGLLAWPPLPTQEITVDFKTGHLRPTPALSEFLLNPRDAYIWMRGTLRKPKRALECHWTNGLKSNYYTMAVHLRHNSRFLCCLLQNNKWNNQNSMVSGGHEPQRLIF